MKKAKVKKIFARCILFTFVLGFSSVQREDSIAFSSNTTPSTLTRPYATFFAVHLEAGASLHGKYQEDFWPSLVNLVKLADKYEAKLTLMFSPQWAKYVLEDSTKYSIVKEWQKNGHELALHYHNIYHSDWCGYTNRKDKTFIQDKRFIGTVDEMMALISKLAAPEKVVTMCMGPDKYADSLDKIEIDESDFPEGILYDVEGVNVGLCRPIKTKFKGRTIFHLKHHLLSSHPERRGELEKIKEEFNSANSDQILGVVTHEVDFKMDPEYIEKWFKFVSEKKMKIKTVSEIMKNYPHDKIVELKYSPQEKIALPTPMSISGPPVVPYYASTFDLPPLPPQVMPMPESGLFAKVHKFHSLLIEKKMLGYNTSKAEALDLKSREAAMRNDFKTAEKLLDKAIKILEQLPTK